MPFTIPNKGFKKIEILIRLYIDGFSSDFGFSFVFTMFEEANLFSSFLSSINVGEEESFSLIGLKNN